MTVLACDAIVLRRARPADAPALLRLHRAALSAIDERFYSAGQVASFLHHVPTLDEPMLADGTYFVAEVHGELVGAGGWSARAPGYAVAGLGLPRPGGLRPRVRGMYTHPAWARRGIGRRILRAAEQQAVAAGYATIELDALLPAVRLYRRCGYRVLGDLSARLPNGTRLTVIHMDKRLVEVLEQEAQALAA